jgi:hypothetical protein
MVDGCVARASPRPRVARGQGQLAKRRTLGGVRTRKKVVGSCASPISRTGSLCET